MKLQEWIAALCGWLGVTDVTAVQVAVGAVTAGLVLGVVYFVITLALALIVSSMRS